ncbi:MAG: polysaccharide deacetylase family protein, partial [Alphaproteobacteria bacterium]
MDAENGAATKRVVIHEDDVGMTHGSNVAFAELSASGALTCGSVMVPCPWFEEAADRFGADPAYDLGVHLTLTSEKKGYRWRPLVAVSPAAGLTDGNGCFWPDVPSVRAHADPAAVEDELTAQVDQALASGIDVTHLDAHMGTVLCPEFAAIYLRLGRRFRLPILLPRDIMAYNPTGYSGPLSRAPYDAVRDEAAAAGFDLFDSVPETPWDRTADAVTAYRAMFDGIGAGLTFLSLHFNAPGDFEVIEPAFAHIRTDEYALFLSGATRAWAAELGLEP